MFAEAKTFLGTSAISFNDGIANGVAQVAFMAALSLTKPIANMFIAGTIAYSDYAIGFDSLKKTEPTRVQSYTPSTTWVYAAQHQLAQSQPIYHTTASKLTSSSSSSPFSSVAFAQNIGITHVNNNNLIQTPTQIAQPQSPISVLIAISVFAILILVGAGIVVENVRDINRIPRRSTASARHSSTSTTTNASAVLPPISTRAASPMVSGGGGGSIQPYSSFGHPDQIAKAIQEMFRKRWVRPSAPPPPPPPSPPVVDVDDRSPPKNSEWSWIQLALISLCSYTLTRAFESWRQERHAARRTQAQDTAELDEPITLVNMNDTKITNEVEQHAVRKEVVQKAVVRQKEIRAPVCINVRSNSLRRSPTNTIKDTESTFTMYAPLARYYTDIEPQETEVVEAIASLVQVSTPELELSFKLRHPYAWVGFTTAAFSVVLLLALSVPLALVWAHQRLMNNIDWWAVCGDFLSHLPYPLQPLELWNTAKRTTGLIVGGLAWWYRKTTDECMADLVCEESPKAQASLTQGDQQGYVSYEYKDPFESDTDAIASATPVQNGRIPVWPIEMQRAPSFEAAMAEYLAYQDIALSGENGVPDNTTATEDDATPEDTIMHEYSVTSEEFCVPEAKTVPETTTMEDNTSPEDYVMPEETIAPEPEAVTALALTVILEHTTTEEVEDNHMPEEMISPQPEDAITPIPDSVKIIPALEVMPEDTTTEEITLPEYNTVPENNIMFEVTSIAEVEIFAEHTDAMPESTVTPEETATRPNNGMLENDILWVEDTTTTVVTAQSVPENNITLEDFTPYAIAHKDNLASEGNATLWDSTAFAGNAPEQVQNTHELSQNTISPFYSGHTESGNIFGDDLGQETLSDISVQYFGQNSSGQDIVQFPSEGELSLDHSLKSDHEQRLIAEKQEFDTIMNDIFESPIYKKLPEVNEPTVSTTATPMSLDDFWENETANQLSLDNFIPVSATGRGITESIWSVRSTPLEMTPQPVLFNPGLQGPSLSTSRQGNGKNPKHKSARDSRSNRLQNVQKRRIYATHKEQEDEDGWTSSGIAELDGAVRDMLVLSAENQHRRNEVEQHRPTPPPAMQPKNGNGTRTSPSRLLPNIHDQQNPTSQNNHHSSTTASSSAPRSHPPHDGTGTSNGIDRISGVIHAIEVITNVEDRENHRIASVRPLNPSAPVFVPRGCYEVPEVSSPPIDVSRLQLVLDVVPVFEVNLDDREYCARLKRLCDNNGIDR